ncbi:unnamed protein product [Paramecium sonneborni]|uniref:Uncharacterized protein n=1 Tax=Paramecium sonneborni TaxID=65129 RepID=A0A8S1RHN9_9CILI|nr:unnamed protein product [Paramecium sonneborni]
MFQKTQNNQYMIDLCQAQVFLEKGKQKKMYYKILKNQQQENNQFNQIEIDQAYSAYRKYFQDAAILFENKLNDQIIAANSYYSGKYFEQSIIIFLNKNKLPEAAKAAEKAQLTLMAAIIQLKLSNIDKCISLLRIDVDNSCFYLEVLNYAKKNNLINHSKLKEELQFIEKSQNNIFKQLPQMKIQHNLEDLCNSYIRTRTQFINTFNKQIKLFLNSSFKQNDWYTNLFDTVQIFSNIIIEEVKRQSIKKENSYFQFLENEFQKSLIDYANRDIQYFVVSYLEAIECFELLKILKTNRTHLYQLELSPHDPNNLINKIGSQLDLQYFIFKKKMFYLSEDQLQYYNSQKYKQINDTQFQIFLLTHKQNQDGLSQCKKKIENELNSKSYVKILFCVEQELQIQEFQKLLQNMLNNNNQTQNIVDITLKKLNKVFSLNLNNQLKHLEELFNIDFKQDHIKQVEQYTTLFYVLFKFHFENRKMDEIFENISLQACFKIMFLLLSGSLLYQFDFRKNFQNSLFRAISIVFKIYIFQSDSLNFIGQAFAVIQKDSYLKLFNKEGSINLEGGCYLFDSIKVIQQIQKKFINLIFNIKPTQICTKLIFQNEKEKKLVKIEVTKEEELIFIESLKKLMQKTKQEKENKNKNKKENKNNLLKVIINLNFLLSFTNISLNNNFQFLQAVDVSYHLRFYEVKRNCVSIFAIILWFKFIQSKSVRSDFLSLYQDVQLQYEVTYIVLCLLLSFASLKENNHIKLDVTEFEFIKFQEQQINQEEKEEGIDTESSKAQKNEDRIEFWKKYSDAYVKLKKLYYDEENQQNIQNPIKYMQFNLILTRELFEYIQIHLYQNEELILDNNNFMKDFATFPLLCECVLKVIINIILKSRENQEHNLNYYLKLFKVLIINLKQLTIDQTNIFSQNLLNIFQELEKEKILNHDIMTDTKNILHQFMSSDGIFGIVESYSLNTNYSQNYTKVKQDETNSLITYYKLRMNLTGKSTLEDKKVEKVYQKIYQLKSFLNEVALNANLNFYEFSQINELIYDIDLLEKKIGLIQ